MRPASISALGKPAAGGQHPSGEQFYGYDEKAEECLQKAGKIPLCLRIGVTGHRDIHDPARVQQEVADAVRWLVDELDLVKVSEQAPVWLQVLTPLAAGADQIVAEAVISLEIRGTTLRIPMPSDEDRYKESIGVKGSAALNRYSRLRHRDHTTITKLPGTTVDDAGFRKVGEWVVDHCDILLALWDGQRPPRSGPAGAPPGTAAIVSYALSHPREIPVIVVPVARGQRGDVPAQEALPPRQLLLRTERANPFVDLRWRVSGLNGSEPTGLSPRLTDQLDVFPRWDQDGQASPGEQERENEFERSIRSWPLDADGGRALRRNVLGVTIRHIKRFNNIKGPLPKAVNSFSTLVDQALGTNVGPIPRAASEVENWASSRFLRADSLAARYQQKSRRLERSIYVLAALSVLVAAGRTIWTTPGSAAALVLSYLDVFILAVVSAVLLSDWRGRVRDQWVCFRAMAEYLRTYMFLALIDPRQNRSANEEQPSLTSLGLSEFVGQAWFDHSMKAIWQHRPDLPPWSETDDRESLQRVLCGWVVDQEKYHYGTEKAHASLHSRFLIVVTSLFMVTVLAALVHIFVAGDETDAILNFVAIGVPGAAAAVNSIAASGEHHRHSVRSRAAKHRLAYLYYPAIMEASTLPDLRRQAEVLARYILGEATDWYEGMAVHSTDIPT
jgi:hypothetical protein